MEKFVKLGEERIRLSEIKSYSATDGDLCIETEDDYFTYYKEDVENLDAVIKYLDNELVVDVTKADTPKIDVSTLSAVEPKTSLDITWDDILKGNIFNKKEISLIPFTVYDFVEDHNKIYKLNVLNHMLKLMKDNIPGFDSRSSLFTFGTLLEFNDTGFINKFNLRTDNFVIKYNLLGSFNYVMIMVVKQLYKYMISTGYLKEIPEFDWDVEERLWNCNGNLRLEEEDIDLIMKLINGELIDELNLLRVKEITINMTSKKIIDAYFDLNFIMTNNFKREMPYNIIDETDPLKKFISLRSLFSNVINNECGIIACNYK
ncbi:MAG: hypothetical protein JTJ21_05775 [Holdemanella sp.]|nr:hypothetical protein [Holdemanella sp.]